MKEKTGWKLINVKCYEKYFFIHWNDDELKEKINPLKKAGFKVDFHFNQETTANFKDNLPECLIICLDRLPLHGKSYAEWMWEVKKGSTS